MGEQAGDSVASGRYIWPLHGRCTTVTKVAWRPTEGGAGGEGDGGDTLLQWLQRAWRVRPAGSLCVQGTVARLRLQRASRRGRG